MAPIWHGEKVEIWWKIRSHNYAQRESTRIRIQRQVKKICSFTREGATLGGIANCQKKKKKKKRGEHSKYNRGRLREKCEKFIEIAKNK